MVVRAAFPGSFNPPTVAHLTIAEAAWRQCGVDRVDLVLSLRAIDKEDVRPSVDERAGVLRTVAESRPWLGVVVTEHRLLADIADGYDVLVLGADKWEQVLDPAYYDSIGDMHAAVARLPHLAVAARRDHTLPTGSAVTILEVDHDDVSSTAARAGAVELMLPEARSSGLW